MEHVADGAQPGAPYVLGLDGVAAVVERTRRQGQARAGVPSRPERVRRSRWWKASPSQSEPTNAASASSAYSGTTTSRQVAPAASQLGQRGLEARLELGVRDAPGAPGATGAVGVA